MGLPPPPPLEDDAEIMPIPSPPLMSPPSPPVQLEEQAVPAVGGEEEGVEEKLTAENEACESNSQCQVEDRGESQVVLSSFGFEEKSVKEKQVEQEECLEVRESEQEEGLNEQRNEADGELQREVKRELGVGTLSKVVENEEEAREAEAAVSSSIETNNDAVQVEESVAVIPSPPAVPPNALSCGIPGIASVPPEASSSSSSKSSSFAPESSVVSTLKSPEAPKSEEALPTSVRKPEEDKQSCAAALGEPQVPEFGGESCIDRAEAACEKAAGVKSDFEVEEDHTLFMQPPNYPPPDLLEEESKTQTPLDAAVDKILQKRQLRRRQKKASLPTNRGHKRPGDATILNQCRAVWQRYSADQNYNNSIQNTPKEPRERIVVIGDAFVTLDRILRPFEDSVTALVEGHRFLAVEDTTKLTRATQVTVWIDQGLSKLVWGRDREFGPRRSVLFKDILQIYVDSSSSFKLHCASVSGFRTQDSTHALDLRLSCQQEAVIEFWLKSLLILCNSAVLLGKERLTRKQACNNGDVVC